MAGPDGYRHTARMSDDPRDDADPHVEALTGLLLPLLSAIDGLQYAQRHLYPPLLVQLAARVEGLAPPLASGLAAFQALEWPEHMAPFREHLETAVEMARRGIEGLVQAQDEPEGIVAAYRGLRHIPRALEALYPLTRGLAPVSRFFLEDHAAADPELMRRLTEATGGPGEVGVMHAQNERNERGGFSLYVPEYDDGSEPRPLVMVLHGGTGHGRAFLWTWLKEARSRGLILIAPTARDMTWSLMPPDIDTENIEAMLAWVRERWAVDESRMLLTGMSDGGTFTYVSGLRAASPFTHLAPIAASFHPMMMDFLEGPRIEGRRIYLTHGKLDWMFNIDVARTANAVLTQAGADVEYREIDDLSHTYPREENARILDWFLH